MNVLFEILFIWAVIIGLVRWAHGSKIGDGLGDVREEARRQREMRRVERIRGNEHIRELARQEVRENQRQAQIRGR